MYIYATVCVCVCVCGEGERDKRKEKGVSARVEGKDRLAVEKEKKRGGVLIALPLS